MSKNFYGRSSNVHAEVELKKASLEIKCAVLLCFGVAFLGAGFLAVGCIFDIQRVILIGALLLCLMPLVMMNAIRTTVSAEVKKTFVYRLCVSLFPGLGLFFFVAIIGAQFAEDLGCYILHLVMIVLPLAFLIPGICLLRKRSADRKKEQRCCAEVWATCMEVEENRDRMTLSDDIVESRPFDDYNKASFFTPTFSYEYNGQSYVKKMEEGAGNLNADFVPGRSIKLRIDPNHPEEVLWSPVSKKFELVMGLLFVLTGVIAAATCLTVFMVSYNW